MFQKFVLLVTVFSIAITMFGCDRKMESSVMDAVMDDNNPETDAPTIKLQLHPHHDTGFSSWDGITHLGTDKTVMLIGALSNGVFSQGDRIDIAWSDALRANDNPPPMLKLYRVGILPGEGWLDVEGHDHIVVEIPRSALREGANHLKAIYYRLDTSNPTEGETLTITVDPVPPIITISHRSDDLQLRIAAIDADHGMTMWRYKVIAGDAVWEANTAADGTVAYTEGSELLFSAGIDNGKKVGFMVTDAAGNISYETSKIIQVPNP